MKGFTILEMLITLAILAMVLFPIYEFMRQGALAWEVGENKTEVVQNARIGLDKMCDELKHAQEFYTITANQVRFWWRDINDDEIADANEILTYSWSGISGESLTRKFDNEPAATPLADYVDSLEYRYFDETKAQTAVAGNVFFLTATLRIKKTVRGNDYTSVMRKSVCARNINW
ncbi:MAG: prepilin-type N-terminal cleavage/methylation domain-containing protein [Candidatus Omnitrophica bacterium]|nr:prepilin-type N-terminal cleavage/methylation domain-containing protein [Candidatus Omnitrophota bacterium]MCG2702876.1 prepilin-type N-terminal cleavage/methylation domain-containing protein [Candidatus Omnitrophota bacterium]